MTNVTVVGVDEKQLKTILETSHGLCNGVKGEYRTMARKVFAVVFGTKVDDPKKNHVLQSLKAAKKCALTLDGNSVLGEKIQMSTYEAVKSGKIEVESAVWDATTDYLTLDAVTM